MHQIYLLLYDVLNNNRIYATYNFRKQFPDSRVKHLLKIIKRKLTLNFSNFKFNILELKLYCRQSIYKTVYKYSYF